MKNINLNLNIDKTNDFFNNLDIQYLTIKINETNTTKFLGVYTDDDMKWTTYCNCA